MDIKFELLSLCVHKRMKIFIQVIKNKKLGIDLNSKVAQNEKSDENLNRIMDAMDVKCIKMYFNIT